MRRAIFTAFALCLVLMSATGFSTHEMGLSNKISARPGLSGDLLRGGGPAYWTGDTLIYVFTYEPDTTAITAEHSEYNFWISQADSVIDLSDPATGFAYCMISEMYPDVDVADMDSTGMDRPDIYMYAFSATNTANRWSTNDAGRKHVLTYIPVENYIKAGSQVVWAYQKQPINATYMSDGDTISVTLMTNENDSEWYGEVGAYADSDSLRRYAHASWDYQTEGAFGGSADANAWNPTWDNRDWFWEIGSYTDWSGVVPSANPLPLGTELNISWTNCVQAAVNGATNNGVCLQYNDYGGNQALYAMAWNPADAAGANYVPMLVVKVVDRAYASPWSNNRDFVVSIQSDDGKRKINKLLADTLAARGGKFTTFLTSGTMLASQLADSTWALPNWFVDWRQSGVAEIGSHSVSSFPDSGIAGFYTADSLAVGEYTDGMYPTALTAAATGYDWMLYETDPDFLYHMADSLGVDMDADPYWGKSLGTPVRNHAPAVQKALAYHDYAAYRVLAGARGLTDGYGNREWRSVAVERPANADTAYAGIRHNQQLTARNMMMLANSHGVNDFVGTDTNTVYTEEQVKLLTRSAIEAARATGRGYIAFLTHDVKTNGDGNYSGGNIDPIELSYMCDVFDEYGSPYVFLSEAARWLKTWADPIQTPDDYTIDDDFKFRADELVWYKPHGVENRFIRAANHLSDIPPDYPRSLEADYFDDGSGNLSVYLEWSPNTESDIAAYWVYRSTVSGEYGQSKFVGWAFPGAEYYNDATGLVSGVTYYYTVSAIDNDGNFSIYAEEIAITPTAIPDEPLYFPTEIRGQNVLAINPGTAGTDSLRLTVNFDLNKSEGVYAKMISWYYGNGVTESAPADTTDTNYPDSHAWLNAEHYLGDPTVTFDTSIPSPSAQEDSALTLVWSVVDSTGSSAYPDFYTLERKHNDGDWEVVHQAVTGTDSTFLHYGASGDTLVAVRKGKEWYRIRGYTGTYANQSDQTAWDYMDSPYYNQAVEGFFYLHAYDGTDYAKSDQTTSLIYATPTVPEADTAAPDTTSYTPVTFSVTGIDSSNVFLNLAAAADEPALALWEWKEGAGGTWSGPSTWSQSIVPGDTATYNATVTDTIRTTMAAADLHGEDIYVRFALKDDEATPNVSNWFTPDPVPYSRQAVVVDDTVGTIAGGLAGTSYTTFNVGTTAHGGWITSPVTGTITSAHVYIGNISGTFNLRAALYDTSGTKDLITEGEFTTSSASSGWQTVTFDTPGAVTSGEPYIVMFLGDNGRIYYNLEGVEGEGTTDISFADYVGAYANGLDDPMTPAAEYDARRYSFYLTHSDGTAAPPTVQITSLNASALFDTTSTSNVVLNLGSSTNRASIVAWQIANTYERSWRPAIGSVEWSSNGTGATVDSSFTTSQTDTIPTLMSTTDLDSLYIQAYARAPDDLVSAADEYVISFQANRAAEGGGGSSNAGYETIGSSSTSMSTNAYGVRITMTEAGTPQSATVFLSGVPGSTMNFKACLTDTTHTKIAGLIGELNSTTAAAFNWFTIDFDTPTEIAAGEYFLWLLCDGSGAQLRYDGITADGDIWWVDVGPSYSTFMDSAPSPESSGVDRRYSAYITYE